MRKMPAVVASAVLATVLAAGVYYSGDSANPAASDSPFANDAGATLAAEKGCIACHTLDGTAGIGPTWKGTYGTLRTLNDDSQVAADEAYIRKSIRDPAADVVKGFENVMVAPDLSDAELGQLVQLIIELGTATSQ